MVAPATGGQHVGEHRARLHHPATAAHDARVANCGATADCEGADGAAPITHGVGAAWPMVNDSEIVALNESVMEKNSTLIDT